MNFANPSPLALFGFAMPTMLLSICNTGIYKMNGALLGLAIAHGGLSQLVVGILLFFKGATFGHVVFFSYGAFWWSVAILVAMPGIAPGGFSAASGEFMGAFFLLWGIFSFFCWICTFKQNRVVQFIFFVLIIAFMLLSIGHWRPESTNSIKAAGWIGLICGGSAFYLGLAELLLDSTGYVLLPIWDPRNVAKEREWASNWVKLLTTVPRAAEKLADLEVGMEKKNAADIVWAHSEKAPHPQGGGAPVMRRDPSSDELVSGKHAVGSA